MLASLGAADWVQTDDGFREGLFAQCIKKGTPTPIPLGGTPEPGCRKAHSAGYVRAAAALAVICFITDFFGTLLTGLGLRSTDPNKKYKYYRVAIYTLAAAVIALFLAIIIYPTSMAKEMEAEPTLDGGRVQAPKYYGDFDFDNDGIMDHIDDDDDNDGLKDDVDDDDDNDGIPDDIDDDDDNDGISDEFDGDDDDLDNDGVIDSLDDDDDNDGVPDHLDTDDDNDGISDELDDDDDNDGIPDAIDNDDDNDGIPDSLDLSGDEREWGFGFGSAVFSLIFLVLSLVLLICDRESEEIFYKEREAEDEEGEEEKEEA